MKSILSLINILKVVKALLCHRLVYTVPWSLPRRCRTEQIGKQLSTVQDVGINANTCREIQSIHKD